MFSGLLDRWVRKEVEKTFPQAMKKALDDALPRLVHDQMRKLFREKPDQPLTEVGFNWALAFALQEFWPDVPNQEAVRWLREYIEVPHGHPDYAWSYSAAQQIAAEYVNEVGEVA